MAKNNPQQSIFDEEELLQTAMENLRVLQERIKNNPGAVLTDDEKSFVMGLGNGSQFTKPIVNVQKLEDKKVSPFAKMVMTVATTFANAKKAFKIFNEEVEEKAEIKSKNNEINQEPVGIGSLGIKEALSSAVNTMSASGKSLTNKTSFAFKDKVSGVTDGVARKIEGLSNTFDGKVENGKSRFLEIYDDVTLQALGARKNAVSVIDSVKTGIKAGTNKFKPFVDMFEEPWINVSFRGDKGLNVEKFSYNTGLAMGKAAKTMRTFLTEIIEQREEVNAVLANRAKEAKERRENGVNSVNSVENNTEEVNPIVNKEATGIIDVTSEVPTSSPNVSKSFGASIGSAGITDLAKPAMVMQDTTGPKTPDVASAVGAAPSSVSVETPNINVSIPGEKMEQVKKPSFLKRLANAFKIESVASEYQKKLDSGEIPEVIAKKVDFNNVKLISSFTRKPNGALPEPSEIFENTENLLKSKIGIVVNEQGYYHFPKTDFNENGEKNPLNKKMHILTRDVQPAYVEIMKEAFTFLQDVNYRVKNDPQLKRFNEFAETVGGTKSALNLLEQAKMSDNGAESLGYLNIKDLNAIYNAYSKDPMKFQESHYLLEAATLNLKAVVSAGNALNTEIYMMKESNPEAKMFSSRLNDEILISGENSNNGISVRLGDIFTKAEKMNFSDVTAKKGNESIVFRKSHHVIEIERASNENVQRYKNAVKTQMEQQMGISEVEKGNLTSRESFAVGKNDNVVEDSRTTAKNDDVSLSVQVAKENAYQYGETNYYNHLRSEGFQGSRDNVNVIPRPVSTPYMPNPAPIENMADTNPTPSTPMSVGSAPQPKDHLPDMPTVSNQEPEVKPQMEINKSAIDDVRSGDTKNTTAIPNRFGRKP